MVSALLFPGQGAQKVGMGRDLAEAFPAARRVFDQIDAALDAPLTPVMWGGPEDALQRTDVAQPAILAHSAAVLAVVQDRLGTVVGAAGHSLGEYSAYVAAGSLSPVEAARLVRERGRLMHEAGVARRGTMAAVLGLPEEAVERICREVSAPNDLVVPANLNTPEQTVISGDPAAVARAGERCKAVGAKRIVPLKVDGAFHSSLMAPAVDGLRQALAHARFEAPRFPVVANATATPVRSVAAARQLLAEQVTAPVRWIESMRILASLASEELCFVEIGPGNTLRGLLKRILPEARYLAFGTAADMEALVR